MRLTETAADKDSVVKKIGGDRHFRSRISAIGITEGTPLQTVKTDAKMPLLIYCRETLIAVNRADAERIEVEAV